MIRPSASTNRGTSTPPSVAGAVPKMTVVAATSPIPYVNDVIRALDALFAAEARDAHHLGAYHRLVDASTLACIAL